MSQLNNLPIITDSMAQANIADSLHQAHIADSLHHVFVADSLHKIFVADSLAAVHLAAKQTIFGDESTLSVATHHATQHISRNGIYLGVESLTSNPIFIALAILFFLIYLLWVPHILRNGSIRWSYLKRHRHVRGEGERDVVGRQRIGVLVVAWSLFTTLLSMITIRAVAQFSSFDLDLSGESWIGGGIVAVLAIATYEWLILQLGGYLSLNMEFVGKILSAKRQLMILCAIFASPLFIISSLANYNQGELVMQLAVCMAIIFILIFLRQSFLLFMRQNFSILHWFLYLCGVEILPLTFIWAIITRYIAI